MGFYYLFIQMGSFFNGNWILLKAKQHKRHILESKKPSKGEAKETQSNQKVEKEQKTPRSLDNSQGPMMTTGDCLPIPSFARLSATSLANLFTWDKTTFSFNAQSKISSATPTNHQGGWEDLEAQRKMQKESHRWNYSNSIDGREMIYYGFYSKNQGFKNCIEWATQSPPPLGLVRPIRH